MSRTKKKVVRSEEAAYEQQKWNIYSMMLLLAFVSLVVGIIFLCLELSAYEWDYTASKAPIAAQLQPQQRRSTVIWWSAAAGIALLLGFYLLQPAAETPFAKNFAVRNNPEWSTRPLQNSATANGPFGHIRCHQETSGARTPWDRLRHRKLEACRQQHRHEWSSRAL